MGGADTTITAAACGIHLVGLPQPCAAAAFEIPQLRRPDLRYRTSRRPVSLGPRKRDFGQELTCQQLKLTCQPARFFGSRLWFGVLDVGGYDLE